MPQAKGNITGHYIAHWGVPHGIFPRTVPGIEEFAIIEFAPNDAFPTWRYATNGMSSYLQTNPDSALPTRTELFASTRNRVSWVHDLLAALARYPIDCQTYFTEYDTVQVGQAIDRDRSCYTGIMLAPPHPGTLGLVGGLSEVILVHEVVGLLPSELEEASTGSGEEWWGRLQTAKRPLLDEPR